MDNDNIPAADTEVKESSFINGESTSVETLDNSGLTKGSSHDLSSGRTIIKNVSLLFLISVSALLSVICVLLFISTLPAEKYMDFSGFYVLSHAEYGDSVINDSEPGIDLSLKLSSNGWAHLYLGSEVHHGRWENSGTEISLRFWDTKLMLEADDGILKFHDLMGRGMDLILYKE